MLYIPRSFLLFIYSFKASVCIYVWESSFCNSLPYFFYLTKHHHHYHHQDAAGDALVLNKWFGLQALSDLPDVLDKVKALKSHPDFIISNPNRARYTIFSCYCFALISFISHLFFIIIDAFCTTTFLAGPNWNVWIMDCATILVDIC
jgi:hypothetical protein